MRLGTPGGLALLLRHGCGKLPARAAGHHCLPVLKRSSLPLPQNNCQYQESDLETDTSVRKPRIAKVWPMRPVESRLPAGGNTAGEEEGHSHVGHVLFAGTSTSPS